MLSNIKKLEALVVHSEHESVEEIEAREKKFMDLARNNLDDLQSLLRDQKTDKEIIYSSYNILLRDEFFYTLLKSEFNRLFDEFKILNEKKESSDLLTAFIEAKEFSHLFNHIKNRLETGIVSGERNVRCFCVYLASDFILEENCSLLKALLHAQSEDADWQVRCNAYASLVFLKDDYMRDFTLPTQRSLDKILSYVFSKKLIEREIIHISSSVVTTRTY